MLIAHLGEHAVTDVFGNRKIEPLHESEYSLNGVFQLPVLVRDIASGVRLYMYNGRRSIYQTP